MDYDDNDFQGHNLQLAGEGSSKFSPVLRPYALPKFDFDDGLQGHLRFDSLVENEVFLGIPSQEDNQWIEDFSRGSSGIEFSSSATESCSISRHNNVWSEATSSESVEMLLKSVGQEEMVPEETIFEESDACDELGGLTERMEPHLTQDDKVKDVLDSEPALPSDEFLEHISSLNDVEGTSQTQEVEMSTHGSSRGLDPIASSEQCEIIVTENTPVVHGICDDAHQAEVDTSVNESLDNKMQKDPSDSGMQIDDIGSSSQEIAASVQVLNTPEPEHQVSDVSFEKANCLFKDTVKAVDEYHVLSKENDVDDQILEGIAFETGTHKLENQPSSSKEGSIERHAVETGISSFEKANCLFKDTVKAVDEYHVLSKENDVDDQILVGIAFETGTHKLENQPSSKEGSIEHHAVETGISSFGEPSSLPLKGDGDLQIAEECSEDPCSTGPASKCDPLDLSNGTEINRQFRENMHEDLPEVFEGDSNLEGHTIEVSNMKAGICAGSELKSDRATHGENSFVERKVCFQGSDHQLDSEASVSNSEASLLSGVDNTVACSSTELLGEKHAVDNLKGVDDASGVHKGDSNAEDHASSPMVAGSMQTCEKNLATNPNDVQYSQDIFLNEKVNAKLHNNSSNMVCEIVESLSSDKMVEPSSQGEIVKVNTEVVHGSEYVTSTAGSEPALNATFEKTNLASHDTVGGVPLLSETVAIVDQVIDHLDKNKKTEDDGLTEATLLSLKESSEGVIELGPVLELEKGASDSSAWKLAHVDPSLPTVETCNSARQSEQSVESLHTSIGQSMTMVETSNIASGSEQAVKANESSDNSSNKLEVGPILRDSAIKEVGGPEGLVPGNHEEAAVKRNCEVTSSEVAGLRLIDALIFPPSDAVLVAKKSEVLRKPTFKTLSEVPNNMGQNDHEGNEAVMVSQVITSVKTAPSSEGGGGSTDSVKPNCATPTVISCTVLSQTEKDKKEGVKGSMGKIIPLFEVTVPSISQNVSENDAGKDERSFSFEVHPSAGQSERETSKDGQSTTTIQACKIPTTLKGSPSTPSIGQTDSTMVLELSRGSSQPPDGKFARGGSKGTPERKTRRASGRATGKENAKKGKETTAVRLSERGDKSGSLSGSPARTGQVVQFEGLKPYGNVGVVSIPTCNLPDLNSSALPSPLFQQPFTDVQQVQLRAQIFVYGSLIQGAAPDEPCMVSAFGASDGGRSVWEPVWRFCVERQKSHPNKSETPVQPHSGAKTPDQSIKRGAHQSKVVPSPLGQASSRGTPSPVNSMMPLSSPLWNISTTSDGLQSSGMPRTGLLDYRQTLPSLLPFQTPPARSFVGHNASWLSQAPFPGPWVASPQTSAFDASAQFSVLPMADTVKLAPVKELSAPFSSGTKHASPSTMVHSLGPNVLSGTSSLPDMKKMNALPGQNSTTLKARKRKKVTISEDLGQISFPTQTWTESVCAPVVTSHLSTSVIVSTPDCFVSKGNASKIVTAVSPTSSTDHPKREHNAEQKVIVSEETFSQVEEAKQQAEAAAALAAAAVSHSQRVWNQLDKPKNSGLIPDIEAKLASAAVAVAAAASVAKAAAAAAKLASNAALQAKLMADEALTSSETNNPAQSNAASLSDMNNLGKATPASILRGGDGSNFSSSIIVAAREAAKRRVEAASAASKHAENLDAIVKAAELAAEAVSQAGKIVAMGDSLPLNELVEAGPEGYWRVPQVHSEQGVTLNNDNRERSKADSIGEGLNVFGRRAKDGRLEEAKTTSHGLPPLSREVCREDHTRAVNGISSSFTTSEKDSRGQRSRRASDLAKTIGVVPESEIGSRSASITAQDKYEKGVGTSKENSIKEGCLVEVCKDSDQFKTTWFSANVLSLKDGKAFVCYTQLQSDEGTEFFIFTGPMHWKSCWLVNQFAYLFGIMVFRRHNTDCFVYFCERKFVVSLHSIEHEYWSCCPGSGQLKEWVALEGEASNAPRIRIAHPMTTMRFEGTRKRRRAAVGDYVWSVGDRVDVWIQDCWREGVVTEKNNKDDTTLTVRFPAEGQTSVVKVWHLRPTLVWKDGEWIEWSSSREKDPSSQGDTPQEKRLKLGIPAIERQREARTGLQKEGSRVIFGVPKPGKKRKFMEVSKHYVAESSSKINESNDSAKFAKYLMPQGSRSRGSKNTKIDDKEKQAAESKTKVLKSGKSQSVSGRTLAEKDKFSTSALSAQNDASSVDHMIKDSVSTDDNELGQQSLMEFGSFSNTEGAAEGPVLFSSLALPSDAPSKKTSTSNAKSERVNRGKVAPSSGKLAKVEVTDKVNNANPGKSNLEGVEPRRSNRRIQPTSRLLEGLQSSLIISKIPLLFHMTKVTETRTGVLLLKEITMVDWRFQNDGYQNQRDSMDVG
ncbi:hypothetical protein TEA_015006 [Camellia sinensis var. sinensis]|uniref:Agenet domain-containing protein n=1 Tax=Camellia sinensis var. sinensis TaxID=542762 RepID=A0A4S4EKW9_CAMSN|nr:hypothetical protein TEA_015006 [Camellia sinensis var. sinensis]